MKFRKLDEREKEIETTATNIAFNTIRWALILYTIYSFYMHIGKGRPFPILWMIFAGLCIPADIVRFRMQKKSVEGDEEETKQFNKSIKFGLLCGLVALVFFVVLFVIMFQLRVKQI